jgi:hypothetical protein
VALITHVHFSSDTKLLIVTVDLDDVVSANTNATVAPHIDYACLQFVIASSGSLVS